MPQDKRPVMAGAAFGLLAALTALTAGCSSGQAAPAGGQAAPADFNARGATVKACDTILAYLNDGPATGTFGTSQASTAALAQALNTPLETDLATWVSDMENPDTPNSQTEQDGNKVSADCGAVGVALFR